MSKELKALEERVAILEEAVSGLRRELRFGVFRAEDGAYTGYSYGTFEEAQSDAFSRSSVSVKLDGMMFRQGVLGKYIVKPL